MVHSVEGVAMMDGTLKQIEQRVGERFLRVHRNALVSRAHICAYRSGDGVDRVELQGIDFQPEVSRRNRAEIKRWLNQGI